MAPAMGCTLNKGGRGIKRLRQCVTGSSKASRNVFLVFEALWPNKTVKSVTVFFHTIIKVFNVVLVFN